MQIGLFSISYAGLWGQTPVDLESFIGRAAELGYDTVMLAGKRPQLSPLDVDETAIARLREALNKASVSCAVVAAYNDIGAVSAAEVPILELQIAYVESLCRLGAQLGAKIVRVFTGYSPEGQNPSEMWNRCVAVLREMGDRAARYQMTLAIQNHHDFAVDTSALLELLDEINHPNCKLGFDAWSPALRGENLYEAARLVAPQTAITTNADYIRVARYRYRPDLINYERMVPDLVRAVPFGTGFIDYDGFFKGLSAGGFDGIASYEMCSPIRRGGSLDNLDRYARAYVAWMSERGFRRSSR